MNNKISVCIPAYNVGNYIAQTIDSILAQTYQNFEIVIADDGSCDNTVEIIKEYEYKDSRIKYVSFGSNKGPMYARQKAVNAATGDFITFCDGDDTLRPDYLEILLSKMTDDIDMVIGQLSCITGQGDILPFFIQSKLNYGCEKEGIIQSILNWEIPQGVCGKLFRRNVVDNPNIQILEYATNGEDACVLLQYVDKVRKSALVDEQIYYYYQRNTSSTHSALSERAIIGICKTMLIRSKIISNYPKLKRYEYKYFQKHIILNLYNQDSSSLFFRYICEYGLNKYLGVFDIIKYSGIKIFLKYFIFTLKKSF